MTLRVRNRVTGLVHDVPAGHPALTDGAHDVVEEPVAARKAAPDPLASAPPKPKAKPKRSTARKRK